MNFLKECPVISDNDTLNPALGRFVSVVQTRCFGLIHSYNIWYNISFTSYKPIISITIFNTIDNYITLYVYKQL